jgi:tetratricopeptide (TPR) repeat protein
MSGPTPPPKGYKRTLFDRFGPDAALGIRAASYGLMVCGIIILAVPLAAGGGVSLGGMLLTAVIALIAGALVSVAGWLIGHGSGKGFGMFVAPSGASTPYQKQYSFQESLAVRGHIADAIASYEELIAASPDDVQARFRAAALYVQQGTDLRRAEALYREARALPSVASHEDVFAAQRLIDLYLGPLAEPGRALVELRRLVERYPGTDVATRARETLGKLKANTG